MLPAGPYVVETDLELLEGVPFPGYRRMSTFIHLQAKPGSLGFGQTLTIDPNELDAALKRDQAPSSIPADTDAEQVTLNATTKSRREVADRQAIERGEDEGMAVHPS